MSTDEKAVLCNVLYGLLGAGAGSMFGYLGYLFFSTKKTDSELSRAIQLAKRTTECNELIDQHKEDIVKIRAALKQCDNDVIANNNQMEQGLIGYQFFPSTPSISKYVQYGRLENRIEMADTLTNLLNEYPSLSMVTLDDLNTSWNDWEEHHAKVVSLVKDYLPETYACLNESKLRQDLGQLTL